MTEHENGQSAMFGPKSLIKGEVTLEQDAVIEGCIEGVLKVGGRLTIADTAKVVGIVIADEIQLSGQAEGNIIARELIELHTGAAISGRLYTARLVMGEGVVLQAETNVGPAAMTAANAVIEAFDSQEVLFQAEGEEVEVGGGVEGVEAKASRRVNFVPIAPMAGEVVSSVSANEQPVVVTDSTTVGSILKNMRPLAVETE